MTENERFYVRQLLQLCERLQFDMGGTEASKGCTGLLTRWDNREPTFFYLESSMRTVRSLLERDEALDNSRQPGLG